jgi:hypothetical protein
MRRAGSGRSWAEVSRMEVSGFIVGKTSQHPYQVLPACNRL